MIYVVILLPLFLIIFMVIVIMSKDNPSNSTLVSTNTQPTLPQNNSSNVGNAVVGAVVTTALVGVVAWKLEGALLNRSILRNRAKISKRKANLWN